MGLGKKIVYYRKNKNMTQEELAKQLGISNQAVSKWENEQSCPDVELLPKIADIFEITLDELFERDFVPHKESEESLGVSEALMTECKENPALTGARPEVLNAPVLYTDSVGLPWKDDETLHAALYIGHRLVRGEDIRKRFGRICKNINFCYEGPALNVESSFSVVCGDVQGNVIAGDYVECDNVSQWVTAGTYVECDDVGQWVTSAGYVECSNVGHQVTAGTYAECEDVGGSVTAGTYVECEDVGGSVSAGTYVDCGDVVGDVSAEGNVDCGDVQGSVTAGGMVDCDN